MPSFVLAMMCDRWEYTDDIKSQTSHIYEWGDYVHLLYTAALAVCFGSLSAYALAADKQNWHGSPELITVISILGIAGFYTDCRKHIVEEKLYGESKAKGPHRERRSSS